MKRVATGLGYAGLVGLFVGSIYVVELWANLKVSQFNEHHFNEPDPKFAVFTLAALPTMLAILATGAAWSSLEHHAYSDGRRRLLAAAAGSMVVFMAAALVAGELSQLGDRAF